MAWKLGPNHPEYGEPTGPAVGQPELHFNHVPRDVVDGVECCHRCNAPVASNGQCLACRERTRLRRLGVPT